MPLYISIGFFILTALFPDNVGARNVADSDIIVPPSGFVQIISTSDGSVIVGRISGLTKDTVEFVTELGIITIPRDRIISIITVPQTSINKGVYWFPDPNTSRLFFAPTGRLTPERKGYFADYYLFFPSFNYGVTPKFSLGGGFSIFPTGNMADQVYFLTPKIGLKHSDKLNIAMGALVAKFPDIDGEKSPLVSILYGVGTWGTTERSATLGLGWGLVDSDLAEKPMIVLGGEKRLSRRTAFVTENWVVPGIKNAILSYGIRFLTEKFTTDFALLNPTGGDAIFPGVPYIDFVYHF